MTERPKNLVNPGDRVRRSDGEVENPTDGTVVTAYPGMLTGRLWALVRWDIDQHPGRPEIVHLIAQEELVQIT